ncbi:MAG: potassium channel family protein [Thermoanaerobaculia bacterium]
MIAVTLAIHATGSAYWLGFVGKWRASRKSSERTLHLTVDILSTGMMLLLLHFFEALLWAILYRVLPSQVGLTSFREALYFSLVSFTTLGYGDVTLSPQRELLGPMEAMAGITVIGLTTALLFAVIQRSWKIGHGKKS